MKASESRKVAIEACKNEIEGIEVLISERASAGKTTLQVSPVADGTIAYFKDEGYDVTTVSGPTVFAFIRW